ncbi:MAG: HAD-IA family hydrolase [Ectothiorhodospiraceae bacterium]|nr:HAD-IA family hydrolase [Ectothiorhodospiraceae bacterium]
MRFDCVLFDHDDTLLPTFALRARVLEVAAREVLGRDLDGAAFLGQAHGRSLEQMSGDLTDGDADLAARLVTVYREHYYVENRRGLVPYPGIAELLDALARQRVRIAVVTSKHGLGARGELESTGLARYVEHLVGAEDVERPKPDAEPLRRAMTALGVLPERTLMVGDTSADVLGARAAGTRGAGALWGTRDRQTLRDLAPDYLLEHPSEILSLVRQA